MQWHNLALNSQLWKREVRSLFKPNGPPNGWGYGNSFCKFVPKVTHLLLSRMTAQAWIKVAAHSRDQSVTICQRSKVIIICINDSRFYKVIKHPSQVPSEIVTLVFYPRIRRELPYLQHISTKKYINRVIRQPVNIQEKNSLFPPWDEVLKHYPELLFRVEKGAYRAISSSKCSSGLPSKSLLPLKISNARGPYSSKLIWNKHLGTYSIKNKGL